MDIDVGAQPELCVVALAGAGASARLLPDRRLGTGAWAHALSSSMVPPCANLHRPTTNLPWFRRCWGSHSSRARARVCPYLVCIHASELARRVSHLSP
ncbi:hypothetical protein C2845_PM09G06190 [Panicum miliaceum]|uniref:Uncharacterized protein n=1 Tax=Panicum miliaceum TaxID=4540 RepID=A0A3L6S4N8_PANMI|nr:hypothetical protein C2845_PM09G06190 [Panicum miliaceum]